MQGLHIMYPLVVLELPKEIDILLALLYPFEFDNLKKYNSVIMCSITYFLTH